MSVGAVWVALGKFGGKQARKELSTVALMCTVSHFVTKDDIVWFVARNKSESTGRKSSDTSIHCTFCGSQV